MLIKLLRNPAARLGCKLHEGETGNVSESLGKQLLALGLAEEMTVSIEHVRGIDPAPAIAAPVPPQIVGQKKKAEKS
jgi:hypothetical protein